MWIKLTAGSGPGHCTHFEDEMWIPDEECEGLSRKKMKEWLDDIWDQWICKLSDSYHSTGKATIIKKPSIELYNKEMKKMKSYIKNKKDELKQLKNEMDIRCG